MYRISKEFHFSASHQLDHLPDGHQCARLHGHNYIVRVTLASESLNEDGFVIDYGELEPVKRFIDEKLDHRHLNEIYPRMKTTAELLARDIFEKCAALWDCVESVSVSETPKTWAEYRK